MKNCSIALLLIVSALASGCTNAPIEPAHKQRADVAQQTKKEVLNTCARIAKAAEEGARQRDSGLTKEAVTEELAKTFSKNEVGMGSTAAFTYTDLRGFAMSDFVRSYCKFITVKNNELTDFDKMMLKNQYTRSVECAKSGRTQQREFIECWNEQYQKAVDEQSKR